MIPKKLNLNARCFPDSESWQPIPKADPLTAEQREAFYARLDRTITEILFERQEVAPAISLLSVKRQIESARQEREKRDARRLAQNRQTSTISIH